MNASMAALLLALAAGAGHGPLHARAQEAADTLRPLGSLPGLRACGDAVHGDVQLDARRPVFLLVHGQNGNAAHFGALARVLERHGQQPLCFEYDDRNSLIQISGRLAATIEGVARHLPAPDITVVGHSLGGLVARRALVDDGPDRLRSERLRLRLVTVSAPFAGVEAARKCGDARLRVATLGLTNLACWIVSGDNWREIPPGSEFIRHPGRLRSEVRRHLVVITDERGACRHQLANGRCLRDDAVFSLAEQQHAPVLAAPRTVATIVRAGHAEIIGRPGAPPDKLVDALVRQGFLRRAHPTRGIASGR